VATWLAIESVPFGSTSFVTAESVGLPSTSSTVSAEPPPPPASRSVTVPPLFFRFQVMVG
jgi:hypothetical protein